MKNTHPLLIIAAIASAALALSSCSSQGGSQGGGSGIDATAYSNLTIAMVTHGAPGDTFWDIVRKGAEAAAKKNGVKLLYANDPDGSKQAQLVQQYTDQKVDGIAVSLAKPEAVASAVEAAVAAKIPVVSLNAGSSSWQKLGILTHFGQDEAVAGKAVGAALKAKKFSKPICVIHEQGNVSLEARCGGVKAVLPNTEILYVTGTDNSAIASTVTAKLQTSPTADSIVGLAAPVTVIILAAVATAKSKIAVASFDLNAELAQAVKLGLIELTVDQQPYLQGYEAIDSLVLYNTGGFIIGGGEATLTGPAIVDEDNVDDVLKYSQQGLR